MTSGRFKYRNYIVMLVFLLGAVLAGSAYWAADRLEGGAIVWAALGVAAAILALLLIFVLKVIKREHSIDELVKLHTQDLSEKNEALQANERRFRDIAKVASNRYWELDADYKYSYISEVHRFARGVLSQDFIGVSIFEIGEQTGSGQQWWFDLKRILEAKEEFDEHKVFLPDGDTGNSRVWLLSGIPYHDKDGNFAGYRGISKDITAQERVNDELRRSEARLSRVLESSPVGISIVARENAERLYVNDALARMHGLKNKALFMRQDLRHGWVDKSQYKIILAALADRQEIVNMEVQRARADGSRWWALMSAYDINYEGQDARIYWFHDITDRKTAEEERQKGDRLLRDIVGNLPHAFAFYDADDELAFWNSAYEEEHPTVRHMFKIGMRFEDMLRTGIELGAVNLGGKSVDEFVSERLRHHRQGKEPAVQKLNNGRWVMLQERKTPSGGTTLVRTDITEIKNSEAAIRDRENFISAVLNSTVDAILSVDLDGVIQSANKAAGTLFGCGVDAIISHELIKLFPVDTNGSLENPADSSHKLNLYACVGATQEFEAKRFDGSFFTAELTVSDMQSGENRLFVCVVRDITRRKELDRLKNEFVSTVSHELRTPLTSIVGSLGLLKEGVVGDLTDQAQQMIEIAHSNCDRLVRLINDILDMEKIESGRMDYQMAPLQLSALIQTSVAENQGYAKQCAVRFETSELDEEIFLNGDQDRLKQVMANLLSNAAKFSPAESAVTIGMTDSGPNVRISVSDKGNGIPENFREKIFTKFSQADGSNTRAVAGTGLGLSICKAIVEQHHGSIGFETETGAGTTFYFELPKLAGPAAVSAGTDKKAALEFKSA